MQTDPIGYEDQFNLYAYVANDPVNKTDPTGMCVGPLIIPCGIAAEELIVAGAAAATAACVAYCPSAEDVIDTVDRIFRNDGAPEKASERPAGPKRVDGPLEARSKTDQEGDPAAEGAPHSVPDGKGGYTTYGPRDPITGKPESVKQYRPAPGKSHGPIERPNVKDRPAHVRPDGARVPRPPVVRPPRLDEIPK